jgi:succinyl-CoA synthetase alpha subunit
VSILVDEQTTFIIQGITGREAVTMARECLDYGSRLIGGVTPGRKGRNVHGVPVEDTVRAFTERERVDASVVSVPPGFAADAVFEAIDAGIKLVIVVTERIPRKQVAQFVEYAQQEGTRIIGPNCLGVISPGRTRVGGVGGAAESTRRAFKPGKIGVMSRSGGMTVEIANSLSEADLGVSTAVSIGGDAIIGSTYAELMPLFDEDPDTEGIAIYSEPGGRAEYELAEYMERSGSTKPIVAFMAGRFMDEMPGMRFGHAGTIVEGRADTTASKIANLAAAGITVAERIGDIPRLLQQQLDAAR